MTIIFMHLKRLIRLGNIRREAHREQYYMMKRSSFQGSPAEFAKRRCRRFYE